MLLKAALVCCCALAFVACGGDDAQNAARQTAAPTAAATNEPAAAEPTAPSPPVTPPVDALRTTIGAPVSLPGGVALIVEVGCWQCDSDNGALVRFYRDASGVVQETTLLGGVRHPHNVSPDGSQIGFSSCTRGICDGFNPTSPDVQTTIAWSKDGGVTSESFAPIDGDYFTAAVVRGMLLASGYTADQQPLPMLRYPGGDEFAVPARGDAPIAIGRDVVAFLTEDRSRLLLGPDVEELDLGPGRRISDIAPEDAAGNRLVVEWSQVEANGATKLYTSILVLGEQPYRYNIERTYAVDGSIGLAGGWLDADTLIATFLFNNADLPGHGPSDIGSRPLPALFDLKTGVIHPIVDPFMGGPHDHGRNFVLAVIPGTFARVVKTGDCLNLRSEPQADAPIKVCAADDVLLRLRGQQEIVGGVTWELVEMPDGTDGWASAEFLAR